MPRQTESSVYRGARSLWVVSTRWYGLSPLVCTVCTAHLPSVLPFCRPETGKYKVPGSRSKVECVCASLGSS